MRDPARIRGDVGAVLLLMLVATGAARAQVTIPPTWGGDLADRPRLTGDWGGVRDELGRKGVELDVDLLLTPQAVLSGGRTTGAELWGNVDYTLNVDTHKAFGLPGGYFEIEVDTGFGSNVQRDSAALVALNVATLVPGFNDRTTALTNATWTQTLTASTSLVVGKVNTVDTGTTEFYGSYRRQFLNDAFASPMTLEQVPFAAWGVGLTVNPSERLSFSLLALNPEGTPTSNPVFGDGVELTGSAQLTVQPAGLVGHQGLGFSWNNKQRYSLEQDPSNIGVLLLETKFPRLADPGPELHAILAKYFPELLVPTVPANTKDSSWAVSYTFDQYFWQPAQQPDKGIGVFFAAGVSDGNPNPIRYAYFGGIGGKGIVPGRPKDSFGIGIANTRFSSEFLPFLREQLALGLEREDAFEAYYNASLTGWLGVSADLQVVSPALERVLAGTALVPVNTAVIAGLRAWARF